MKTIAICRYEMSQYHAGQIVTPSARIWCDGEEWHSLVSWYDSSDQSTIEVRDTHTSQSAASKAVDAEVIVMSESWAKADMSRFAKLEKLADKYDLDISWSMNQRGEIRVGEDVVDPRDLVSHLVNSLRDEKFGRWEDGEHDEDAVFVVNEKMAKEFRRKLEAI